MRPTADIGEFRTTSPARSRQLNTEKKDENGATGPLRYTPLIRNHAKRAAVRHKMTSICVVVAQPTGAAPRPPIALGARSGTVQARA